MELRVTLPFPLFMGNLRVLNLRVLNKDLQDLILAEEMEYGSVGRSNICGWHSRPDFLNKTESAVSGLKTWLIWGLRRIIDASAGANAFNGTLSLSGWATVCRAGAY